MGVNRTLWCAGIDHDNKIRGAPFDVPVDPTNSIAILREKVKKIQASKLRDVDTEDLIIWRCTRKLSNPPISDRDLSEVIRGIDLTDEGEAVKLSSRTRLVDVGLGDREMLLVQVPGIYSYERKVDTMEPNTPQKSVNSGNRRTSPRKTEDETQSDVEECLNQYDKQIREYLAGPHWTTFWEAPSSVDPDTKSFIDNLKIPQLRGEPLLLLHDIGNGIIDESILAQLFDHKSRFLVNASGSGKTRLLLEGLSRHWGFYFTAFYHFVTSPLGSADIHDITQNHIPGTNGFSDNPELYFLEEPPRDRAYRDNDYIATRWIYQVIVARILIFKRFLTIARDSQLVQPIHDFRKHWLFLQLFPSNILGGDIFKDLTVLLKEASDTYLMIGQGDIGRKLKNIQNEFSLDEDIIAVLDEAQVAGKCLDKAFRSDRNSLDKRPILKPLVNAWTTSSELSMIVSGTSLNIGFLNEVPSSADAKSRQFLLSTMTGSFDEHTRQREYMARYLPSHFVKSKSGQDFLERAWNWVHGRHRFTASLLSQLLGASFQSPHKIFNAYIKELCGFYPSDRPSYIDEEEKNTVKLPFALSKFDFVRILHEPRTLNLTKDLLFKWLIHKERVPLSDQDLRMVELGIARFHRGEERNAIVDEPLILIAAVQELRDLLGFSFEDHVKDALESADRHNVLLRD